MVGRILNDLMESFSDFKDSTEVKNIMTRGEIYEARGEARSEAKLLPLLAEKDEQLAEKDERIKQLEVQIAENLN